MLKVYISLCLKGSTILKQASKGMYISFNSINKSINIFIMEIKLHVLTMDPLSEKEPVDSEIYYMLLNTNGLSSSKFMEIKEYIDEIIKLKNEDKIEEMDELVEITKNIIIKYKAELTHNKMSDTNNQLRKIINDDELFDKALLLSKTPKVRPSPVSGKNNLIYSLPYPELYKGLDLINKAFKKPATNSMVVYEDSKYPIIIKLNKILKQDPDNMLVVSLILLQTEKEKNIQFIPAKISI